jgi:hypothetical protein
MAFILARAEGNRTRRPEKLLGVQRHERVLGHRERSFLDPIA